MKSLKLLILLLLFVTSSCGQTAPKVEQKQIVVINTSLFYDERVGIIPLVLAVKPIYSEFESKEKELKEIVEKRQNLSAEILRLQNSAQNTTKGTIDKKISEYEILDCSVKNKLEEKKSQFEKKRLELTKDLRFDIAQSIKQFANERGYIIVLDKPQEFVSEDSVDVTMEFINFYHMSPKKK